jgi:hypothetical protein
MRLVRTRDEPAEDGTTFDPLVGEVNGGTVGSWRLQLEGPVRTAPVVVPNVFVECSAEMSLAEDDHAVDDLGAGGEHEPFGVGVGPGAAWWDLAGGDARVGEYGVDGRR